MGRGTGDGGRGTGDGGRGRGTGFDPARRFCSTRALWPSGWRRAWPAGGAGRRPSTLRVPPDPDPVPALRVETGADLRRLILDHARRLLVSDGYDALSMRKIAASAGCSATSIYLHFESKDALTHALISEGMGRLHARLTAALVGSTRPWAGSTRCAGPTSASGSTTRSTTRSCSSSTPSGWPATRPRTTAAPAATWTCSATRSPTAWPAARWRRRARPTWPRPSSGRRSTGWCPLLLARRVDVRVAGGEFIDAAVRQSLAALAPA